MARESIDNFGGGSSKQKCYTQKSNCPNFDIKSIWKIFQIGTIKMRSLRITTTKFIDLDFT